jgi:hypothetical protein
VSHKTAFGEPGCSSAAAAGIDMGGKIQKTSNGKNAAVEVLRVMAVSFQYLSYCRLSLRESCAAFNVAFRSAKVAQLSRSERRH